MATDSIVVDHDGACEYAKSPECNCKCGGKYHQAGWRMIGRVMPFMREKYICIKKGCDKEVGQTELYCEEHR